jgi:hypothetical protein
MLYVGQNQKATGKIRHSKRGTKSVWYREEEFETRILSSWNSYLCTRGMIYDYIFLPE